MFEKIRKAIGLKLGYDVVEDLNRRRMRRFSLKDEDHELLPWARTQLTSSTRDITRNFAAARFAVNLHMAAVTDLHFQSRTGITDLDNRIEELLKWWFRPANFEISGRFGFKPFLRIMEERAVLDGDIGLLKLGGNVAGKIQAIEGDRIAQPFGSAVDATRFYHGVEIDPDTGAYKNFAINKRVMGTSLDFDRIIPAQWLLLYGFFNRFDQRRGISPFSSALAPLQDSYEAATFALLKMKIAAILGFCITREYVPQDDAQEVDKDGNVVPRKKPKYNIDLSKGPFIQNFEPGAKLEAVESKTPSEQFQSFWLSMIGLALKAINIPLSFWQPGLSNYAERRMDTLQWYDYIKMRQDVLKETLNSLIAWRLGVFVRDGWLQLPPKWTIGNLSWEWIAPRPAWINSLDEVQTDVLSLAAGLSSPQRICKQRGQDYQEILAEWAQANKDREALGLPAFNYAAGKTATQQQNQQDQKQPTQGQQERPTPSEDEQEESQQN